MFLTTWLNAELLRVIGWTIIHSMWQCLGLLALLKLFLAVVPLRRSGLRYRAALWVLGVAVLGGLLTFAWEYRVLGGGGFGAGLGQVAGVRVVAAGRPIVEAPMAAGAAGWLGLLGRLSPWLAMGWLLGIMFFSGRLLYSGYGLLRLRRLSDLADGEVSGLLRRLRGKMGLRRPVRLIVSDQVSEPLTFGLLKAVIVLPLHYVSQVPADQVEMILAHELAHIRRRDYLVNLCQSVFDAVFFFNPFYRVLSGIVRNEREYCCDDLAAGVGGDGRMMAVALTNLKLMMRHPGLGLSAAPVRSGFYRRVSRLIEPGAQDVVSVRGALAGLFGAGLLVVVLTQCSRSVISRDALSGTPESMEQVLTDNQAGYKEQVFYFQQGGSQHELFLVSTIEKEEPLYGYVDGARVERGGLDEYVKAIKRGRMITVKYLGVAREDVKKGDTLVRLVVRADSMERELKVRMSAKENTSEAKVELDSIGREQIAVSMEQYNVDVQDLPSAVKQHDLLTRIVVNGEYTPEDRVALRELIRQRQAF
jgi:bla regulator protein blaR1